MKNKLPKETLIGLIQDDLKHHQLIWGLNQLGFKNEKALLTIHQTIFALFELNIHDKRLEYLSDEYLNRAYKVVEIHSKDNESLHGLAQEIYHWLLLERKKYGKYF